jgi:hypothetical protein
MVPVKLRLLVNGRAARLGQPSLKVVRCTGGGALRSLKLNAGSSGRWSGALWTGGLGKGCYKVVATLNGKALGSFRMDVRGQTKACLAAPWMKAR